MGELESKEFEMLLAEKRYKEIIGLMNKILEKLSTPSSDVNVEVDTSGIESALKKLKITSPKANKTIPDSIKAIGDVIVKKIEQIKTEDKPKEWTFDIKRGNNGLIKTVKAKSN